MPPRPFGLTLRDTLARLTLSEAFSEKLDFDTAIKEFTEAIRHTRMETRLPLCARASTLVEMKEYDRAIADLIERSTSIPKPSLLRQRPRRRSVVAKEGPRPGDRRLQRSDPPRSDRLRLAYDNRGLAWSRKKEFDKAIADYGDAIRLDSTVCGVHYNSRAWLWATCPADKMPRWNEGCCIGHESV